MADNNKIRAAEKCLIDNGIGALVSSSEATPDSMEIPASGAVFRIIKSRHIEVSSSSSAPTSLPSA